jgi:hypothetical protein
MPLSQQGDQGWLKHKSIMSNNIRREDKKQKNERLFQILSPLVYTACGLNSLQKNKKKKKKK